LAISPDLTNSADWHLPAYYNDFAGDPPVVILNGTNVLDLDSEPGFAVISGSPVATRHPAQME
jgi:hypothetical protein